MLLSRSAAPQRTATGAATAAATATPTAAFLLPRWRGATSGAPNLRTLQLPPFARGIAAAATGGRSSAGDGGGGTEAEAPAAAVGAAPTSAELVRFLQGKLPQYCCGCGVRLQQKAENLPGFFRIPRKLLDFAAQQALLLGMAEDAGDDATSDPEQRRRLALDKAAEDWLNEQQRPAAVAGGGGEGDDDDEEEDGPAVDVLCERCFGLKHEGKIRRPGAESLLPDFDLAKKVGRKIALQRDRRAVVLVVVDVADFDGSLPRAALRALFPGIEPADGDEPAELPFKLMVAVNKFDLLPPQATPRRVEQWVRLRLRQAGLPRPEAVFPVSAVTGAGVKEMTARIRSDMGFRADLWVVGAQNAGKSSLINAMKRAGGTGGRAEPTVAPVPGTTLGLLRVPGIPLGPKQRVFDTPGVRHAYQLTTRLPLEEVSMVLPRRRLKPRTWRVGEGSTLLLGGLGRVDVLSCPGPTLYLTAFVSDDVVCHMGRVDGAEERREKHVGGQLVPPLSAERLEDLGPLVSRETVVSGGGWDKSAVDVAIAGLGWVGIGVKGEARLRVWAPDGVAVTVHDALIPDYARDFEKPGWSDLLPAKNRARAHAVAVATAAAAAGSGGGGGGSGSDVERGGSSSGDEREERPRGSRGGGRGSGSGRGGRGGGRGRASAGGGGGGRGGRGSRARAAGAF